MRIIALTTLVTVLSFFTIAYNYSEPSNLLWDETYHIASAQRYLNHVFFMEPHPPLGKLLIALGEWMIDANQDDAFAIGTDKIKSLPEGTSFRGYRFFPVMLSALSAPVLFLLVFYLTGGYLRSFLVALCFLFDNAIVVHLRAAMLEGVQIFFILLTMLLVVVMYRRIKAGYWLGGVPIYCGISLGAAVATKVTSVILLPFFIILLPLLRGKVTFGIKTTLQVIVGALFIYGLIWQIHFMLGKSVVTSLSRGGYYHASTETRRIINEGSPASLTSFAPLLRDSLGYLKHYQKGVPKLNLCKEGENGSLPYLWPLGARSIIYRWENADKAIKYFYLQNNPIVWLIGLIGLLLTFSFIVEWICNRERVVAPSEKDREWRLFVVVLLFMWCGYMGVMASLSRVMYLYHYFIPLILTLLLVALAVSRVSFLSQMRSPSLRRFLVAAAITSLVVTSFCFYSPLTYGTPLSVSELESRALFSLWDLRCQNCELTNGIAKPLCNPKEKLTPRVKIGGLTAKSGYQEWGDPQQDIDVNKRPIVIAGERYASGIGVHAYSSLKFTLAKRFQEFTGAAGVPDSQRGKGGQASTVKFEILLDDVVIWHSPQLSTNNQVQPFVLPVAGGVMLELRVTDGGDGIDNDHAVWVNLNLR